MTTRRCDEGSHFYDDAVNAQCPFCFPNGGTAQADAAQSAGTRKPSRGGTLIITGAKLTVGWLIVVDGAMRGHDFRLLSGQNRIGREPSMDVALIGDPSVSGEDHAKLIFDPNGQKFHLWHDKGCNLTYVNGELTDKRVLQAYDRIQIGQTQLLFVPLCGEQFQW